MPRGTPHKLQEERAAESFPIVVLCTTPAQVAAPALHKGRTAPEQVSLVVQARQVVIRTSIRPHRILPHSNLPYPPIHRRVLYQLQRHPHPHKTSLDPHHVRQLRCRDHRRNSKMRWQPCSAEESWKEEHQGDFQHIRFTRPSALHLSASQSYRPPNDRLFPIVVATFESQ